MWTYCKYKFSLWSIISNSLPVTENTGNWLLHITALTCQKVLNSSNQRFAIPWSDKISFCLKEDNNLCHAAINLWSNAIPRDSFPIQDVRSETCVVMIHTPIRIRASALASSVWGRWRFISSPSKSALYGVHTHSLNRNVLWGLTLACSLESSRNWCSA